MPTRSSPPRQYRRQHHHREGPQRGHGWHAGGDRSRQAVTSASSHRRLRPLWRARRSAAGPLSIPAWGGESTQNGPAGSEGATMKAVRLHKEGGPEQLVYEDAPSLSWVLETP